MKRVHVVLSGLRIRLFATIYVFPVGMIAMFMSMWFAVNFTGACGVGSVRWPSSFDNIDSFRPMDQTNGLHPGIQRGVKARLRRTKT